MHADFLSKIGIKEVETSISEVNRLDLLQPIRKLNEHQKTILKILEKYQRLGSGQLYKEYKKLGSNPVGDRAYRKHMEKLVSLGLVKSKGKGRWRRYELIT